MSKKISNKAEIKQFISDYQQSNHILEQFDSIFTSQPVDKTLAEAVKELETSMITDAMYTHNFNKTKAAQQLGISRQVLIYKWRRINQQK